MAIKHKHKNNKGITILEVVIAMVAIGILSSVVAKSLLQLQRSMASTSNRITAQSHLDMATRHILFELKKARRHSITLDQKSGESPYSLITFTNTDDDEISMYQEGSDLIIEKNAGRSTVVRDGISKITFSYPDIADESRIYVSVSSKLPMEKNQTGSMGYSKFLVSLEN